MNTIVWATKAVRQFRKLPTADQRAIGDKVSGLAAWPDVLGVKHLVGRDDYRLRVGRFRVIFSVYPNGKVTIIRIDEVKKRDEHTY